MMNETRDNNNELHPSVNISLLHFSSALSFPLKIISHFFEIPYFKFLSLPLVLLCLWTVVTTPSIFTINNK